MVVIYLDQRRSFIVLWMSKSHKGEKPEIWGQEEKERVAFILCEETGHLNVTGEAMIFKFCDSLRLALSGFQRGSCVVISYENNKVKRVIQLSMIYNKLPQHLSPQSKNYFIISHNSLIWIGLSCVVLLFLMVYERDRMSHVFFFIHMLCLTWGWASISFHVSFNMANLSSLKEG